MRTQTNWKELLRKASLFGLLLGAAMSAPSRFAQAQESEQSLVVRPALETRTVETQSESVFQTVAWRGRYYGRPYGGYYYGPPRARYYTRYPGYYNPYYGGYGYGYGYRGYYYGTPRVGYYDGPYGGGVVRVGPLRFSWR